MTLVPGNHDAYVRRMQHEPARAWGDYMRGDGETEVTFPFVRRRGPVAIVGLSSAIATPPFRATGKLGKEQLQRLPEILAQLGAEGVFRVVMLHHPPRKRRRTGKSERLLDGRALIAVLAQAGAELVIHGHEHINSVSWLDGPEPAHSGRRCAVGIGRARRQVGSRPATISIGSTALPAHGAARWCRARSAPTATAPRPGSA